MTRFEILRHKTLAQLVGMIASILVLAAFLLTWGFEPAFADPPPWAPAHGYRAKAAQGNKHRGPRRHRHPVYARL